MRAAAVVLCVLLAGCAGPGPAPDPRDERPTWTPHPTIGPQPALAPDSAFVATEWGYVLKGWTPPATPEPAILSMEGYQGASAPSPTHYLRLRDGALLALNVLPHDRQVPLAGTDAPRFPGYTQVRASLRGTGCSGGTFGLFDPAGAEDGREAIEWIASQAWTTPRVGMYGLSYGGLTAFYVGATQPPHLAALASNLLVDDYYRGIAYPGGVMNEAFPALWQGTRQQQDSGGTADGLRGRDEVCAFNAAQRGARPLEQPATLMASHPYDDALYASLSLYAHAPRIRAPTTIAHAWQDEQTGPRGARLLALLPDDVPKRLVATNGNHVDAARAAYWDDLRWFDHHLKGADNGVDAQPPVLLRFGTVVKATPGSANYTWDSTGIDVQAASMTLDAFPSPGATWTRHHLRQGGALSPEPPAGAEPPDAYLAGAPRRSWTTADERLEARTAGPDVVVYQGEPLASPQVVAGPVAATLFVSTTAADTDLFVALADVHPDGAVTYLQRGLLRASHRALDPAKSDRNPAGDVIVPHHPHTSSVPVTPGEVVRYDVEVFPFAHVFHAGHRIRLEIGTPPLADGLWGYAPLRVASVNAVHHDAQRPSSILVPTVPWPGVPPPEPACGVPAGYVCVRP